MIVQGRSLVFLIALHLMVCYGLFFPAVNLANNNQGTSEPFTLSTSDERATIELQYDALHRLILWQKLLSNEPILIKRFQYKDNSSLLYCTTEERYEAEHIFLTETYYRTYGLDQGKVNKVLEYIQPYNRTKQLLSLEILRNGILYYVAKGQLTCEMQDWSYYSTAATKLESSLKLKAGSLIPIMISENMFYFQKLSNTEASGRLTIATIHPNEPSAIKAVEEYIKEMGGYGYFFLGNGFLPEHRIRYMKIRLGAETYYFDPNRVFSPEVMENQFYNMVKFDNNVKKYHTESYWNQHEEKWITGFDKYVSIISALGLSSERPFVAVHSNRGYTMNWSKNVFEGQDSLNIARDYHFPDKENPNDFIMVTHFQDFQFLKQYDYNVILQDNKNSPNDGSASILFAKLKKRYVLIEIAEIDDNVQAQKSKIQKAIDMLKLIEKLPTDSQIELDPGIGRE